MRGQFFTVQIGGTICMVPITFTRIGEKMWENRANGWRYSSRAIARMFGIS